MSNYDLLNDLKRAAAKKQLIEISLPNDEDGVAYVMRVNKEFITLAEISASFGLLAVATYRLSDVKAIGLESIYLDEFSKQMTDDSLYQTASRAIEKLKEAGFDSFLKTFAGTNTLVEITNDKDESSMGKIVNYNKDFIVIDEYYVHYDRRYARTVLSRFDVVAMAVSTARARILAKYLETKKS